MPTPFWDGDPVQAEHWLTTDPVIAKLRRDGAWTDINDRIAAFSHYFRAVEHSAQIDGGLLTRREGEFKEGKINLLSCSTTMEMGVDIGGLSAVAMNNVPPHPANFLQRAGRAGRRGETAALSFTLCKNTPQGEAVFRNPLWPFETALAVPQVALQSGRIVQRHINALALTDFLFGETSDGPFRLTAGWFFERQDGDGHSSPSTRFQDWCRQTNTIDAMKAPLQRLCRRSSLSGIPAERLLAQAGAALETVEVSWRDELDALLANLEVLNTREGNSKPERAIGFQLKRLREEYLLGELATRGFLPGYGFPTGVVTLQTSTVETLNARRDQREDNRGQSRGEPSRELAIAIRDYAPGTDTALDGRVYRSGGVSLNWHLPAQLNAGTEVQSLRWVWRCSACGGSGTRPTRPERCPQCNERHSSKLTRLEYLQPAGFAVDIRWQPHNNVSIQQYIPVRDPLISLEGAAWMALTSPALGRYRSSANGHIFQRSDGLHSEGYALCLRCGRADSMGPGGDRPLSLKAHKRLRGGRNNDQELQCPGNAEPGVIKEGLRLGTVVHTDVFELQLRVLDSAQPIDEVSAFSIAVVLRRALCQHIGIEEDEIGVSVSPTRGMAGEPAHSIYLFDTAGGGAGYVGQAILELPALLTAARQLLECHCDKACQICLLSNDTQYHVDLLDRLAAAAVLSERYLTALALPDDLRIFGPATRLELEPLDMALRREIQHQAIDEVRIYLSGATDDWEPLAWPLREDLLRWANAGIIIRLIASRTLLSALPSTQADEIAALASVIGAKFHISNGPPSPFTGTSSTLPLIAEVSGTNHSVCWAASNPTALSPRPGWGSGANQTRFVSVVRHSQLAPLPAAWGEVPPGELRRPVAGLCELRILTELDGPSVDFGTRAWQLISQQDRTLLERLQGTESITRVIYTDRYLKSPLAILLLHSFLAALRGYPGGVAPDTRITITTEKLSRSDTREPYQLFHDWRDAQVRAEVIEGRFTDLGCFEFLEEHKSSLPHARELSLEWPNGRNWTMRLDQGFGYWRLSRGERGQFPFAQGSPQQLSRLRSVNSEIEGNGGCYPTYWYCESATI
ncbi:Zn-binding domain-containing protein [uncultured Lamprocystis sp.]|uniref:Zn-binding domain-containing protein n=1 Tax=uncultured Lamprocystis sp. TaxID=543132 RepID=UPI0025FE5FF5|nr:Zn-binding domain-containing protein [uncultured Lamprocystis sp.]